MKQEHKRVLECDTSDQGGGESGPPVLGLGVVPLVGLQQLVLIDGVQQEADGLVQPRAVLLLVLLGCAIPFLLPLSLIHI